MPVNTSGTFSYNPPAGEILLDAFGCIQVRPTEITQTHLKLGQNAMNYILVELANLQPNLWTVELKTIPLGAGIATYSLPAEIVMITDMYIRYSSPAIDRYIYPISRTEYDALPNKTQQGFPNQYWFERTEAPKVTFYFVPDNNTAYSARYHSVRQVQDVQLSGGDTVEVPYRFLTALVDGVAWRLSRTYQPARTDELFNTYMRTRSEALIQDTENVAVHVTPALTGYWR